MDKSTTINRDIKAELDQILGDKFSPLEINIELLEPSSNNFYGIREINELSESIKEQGLLHNLVVREKEGKYEILSGERRYCALKKLGVKKVPCKVQRNLSDIDSEKKKSVSS